jgi:hypothetical protein
MTPFHCHSIASSRKLLFPGNGLNSCHDYKIVYDAGAHIFTVAVILHVVPFSDLDFRWNFADCDACGRKRAEEREKAEGTGNVEELHGCKVVDMFE